MCGIFGCIGDKASGIDADDVIQTLAHRGPDDHGNIIIDKVLLAHTRLSIIDLSEQGRQPMCNRDRTLWITLNGEIYNYIELKKELADYPFQTLTDTEVILAAYEKWGNSFLTKLRGMFSFGLYDMVKDKFIGAVDRFGIKPFYYHHSDNHFFFSSEIKALIKAGIKSSPNDQAIYDYFTSGMINHNSSTFFNGIFQLRPGQYLEYKNNNINIQEYWDIEPSSYTLGDINEIVDAVDDDFRESVKLHLRSDVEYGLSLSSGLDSNLLRCAIGEIGELKDPLKCFSFCFVNSPYDECTDLDRSDNTGVSYYQAEVTSDTLIDDFSDIISVQEGPIGGAGIYAFWLKTKMVRDAGIKVLLNGQGADELFCGYRYYYDIWLSHLYHTGQMDKLVTVLDNFNISHGTKLKVNSKDFQKLLRRKNNMHMKASDGTSLNQHGYLDKNFIESYEQSVLQFDNKFRCPVKNRMYNDLRYLKIPKLLRFQDKTAMAWGVEVRVPFLDHILFEKIFSMPTDLLLNEGVTKYILRKVAGKYDDPINRSYLKPVKKYMITPQREWLKYELYEPIEDIVNNSLLHDRGYIDKYKLMDQYHIYAKSVELGNSFFIWKFLNMEYLFRVFNL